MLIMKKIVLVNFTETWLDETIKEADIEGFHTYRCDRTSDITRDGVAIYLYDKIETGQIWEKRFNKCEMIGVEIKELQTINLVVYRPPDTKRDEFKVIIDSLKSILNEMDNQNYTIIVSGD